MATQTPLPPASTAPAPSVSAPLTAPTAMDAAAPAVAPTVPAAAPGQAAGASASELDLPQASIARIVRSALPPGMSLSRESKLALSKAASVFILYITAACVHTALRRGVGAAC